MRKEEKQSLLSQIHTPGEQVVLSWSTVSKVTIVKATDFLYEVSVKELCAMQRTRVKAAAEYDILLSNSLSSLAELLSIPLLTAKARFH